jgi:hypothetical protein
MFEQYHEFYNFGVNTRALVKEVKEDIFLLKSALSTLSNKVRGPLGH